MSDSVTNVEIEDVLSSIRRLVSVDASRTPPRNDAKSAQTFSAPDRATPQAPRPPRGEKLVLTSDLRVKPGDPRRMPPRTDTDTLKQRIAELEAAVNAQSTEFEPDGSEDTSQHRPSSIPHRTARPSETAVLPLSSDGIVDVGAFVLQDDMRTAEAPNLSGERADETDEPEGAAEDAPTWSEISASLSDETLMAHLEAAQGADAFAADRAADANEAAQASDDDAGVSHPESGHDAGQPQDDSAERTFAEVLDAEHHRAHPFNASGMADDLAHAGGNDLSLDDEDTLIDEEALREMVSEIVRQELQGALGERITRNVRKLVRREIMRAISIRDFE
ncbi:hypothetical protein [Oceaniglobus indicus]|uniref:hypothetical protein n=1 Tax=Oceaniglobus indicus TaxID=2047749 RepID=UPI000C1A5120|nr:hypothetical protein [Oceaniglobus indicus]